MNVLDTAMPGVKILEPERYGDERGFVAELWNRERWRELGVPFEPVQENHSRSGRGVLRGLHFQAPPAAQGKVVRVFRGEIFDVAVDLRRGSETYGRWIGTTLTAESGRAVYVPAGFAHGFCALSECADVVYLLDAPYAPETEGGLRWDDPDIGIEWPFPPGEMRIVERDRRWPTLAELESPFEMDDRR